MTLTTNAISTIDFNVNSEWLAPYSLYLHEPAGATDCLALPCNAEDAYATTFLPDKKDSDFIKTSREGKFLSNVPSKLLSFLNNRRQYVQDGDTYGTIIEQSDIEILRSFVAGGMAPLPLVVPLSPKADAFCNSQGISQYVKVASDLVYKCFSNIRSVVSELLQDPDTEEQLLVIHVEVQGEIEAVLDMYDKYTDEWVSKVPWPARAKISLSYIII